MNSVEMNTQFKKLIIKNKHEIDYAIETKDIAIMQKLIFELIASYVELIPRIKDDLMIYHTDDMTVDAYKNDLVTIYKQVEFYAKHNTIIELPKMRSKIFNREEFNVYAHQSNGTSHALDLSKVFQQLHDKTMNNGHLTSEQIYEIVEKLDVLEKISNSSDPRPIKWHNTGPVIQWLSSTSVDTGLMFMPVIMRIFEA